MRTPGLLVLASLLISSGLVAEDRLEVELRYQEPVAKASANFHQLTRAESWRPGSTALIICDMWDAHHCVNAVRRGNQIAPKIDALAGMLREQGVMIIHAPSGCMDFYAEHPARLRTMQTKIVDGLPDQIGSWCDQIPAEEAAAYPIDQSDGGEDDDPLDHRLWADQLTALGKNPAAPWTRQSAAIAIDAKQDFISDSGEEIWSILQRGGIDNVILVGVHTNMCVLGRPFGLRRLSAAGKNVVLMRDLTDTMYNPAAWPYASHFTGTDLIVSHVERYVCPTISSDQFFGGNEFRFAHDNRQHLVILVAEDEYQTANTLPEFAAVHLSRDYRVTFAFGDANERNRILNIQAIQAADALLVSVRRRALPEGDLAIVRAFVASGKPVIGIRTASHAFSLRNVEPPAGYAQWPEFDAQVWGGSYTNHFGNTMKVSASPLEPAEAPFMTGDLDGLEPGGSLYKNNPLAAGTLALMQGAVEGEEPHPLAWSYVRADSGRSFYTSLGHVDDFQQAEFRALLLRGIHWACGVEADTSLEAVNQQIQAYASAAGKQR